MALDLVVAVAAMGMLSVLAFHAGIQLGKRRSHRPTLLFAEAIVASLSFAWLYSGNLDWARMIPDSAVLYWSNWTAVLIAFTAGLARQVPGLNRWHRPAAVGALVAVAAGYLVAPVLRPWAVPARLAEVDDWEEGICLQSHASSCGAAAAATLLRLGGMPASEAGMAQACLTSRQGTTPLGLYRGVASTARQFGRSARVAVSDPGKWFASEQLPIIALVRFDDTATPGPLVRLFGPRGEGHAVVVLGRTDSGRWIIGDPAVGRVTWSDEEFRARFTGDAIYLESPASPARP